MALLDSISARHQELVAGIIKNLSGNAEIDWEAVAKDANFSSAKYAKDEYRKVRKALDAGDANGGSTNATPKKKGTPKKRKNDDGETATPKSKKSKKTASSSEEREIQKLEKEDGETLGLIKPGVDSDVEELI